MKLRPQSPLWRRAIRTAGRQLFRFAENNDDPRVDSNGEGWLLRQLLAAHASRSKQPFVAFDAGGNVGDYTREILRAARGAGCAIEIHVFEPSPHCVAALRERFGAEPTVRVVAAALSDRMGEAPLLKGEEGSSQGSLVAREGATTIATAAVTVPLLRLDGYLAEHAITHVDLLKLDVEGSELAALRGLAERLRPETIDVIQFEYGGTTLDAGAMLRDFYRLLIAHGYVVAKLFPRALEVRSYRPWMDHFSYANYVAISPRWMAGAS
jgi:FkbM family methyltransferase